MVRSDRPYSDIEENSFEIRIMVRPDRPYSDIEENSFEREAQMLLCK